MGKNGSDTRKMKCRCCGGNSRWTNDFCDGFGISQGYCGGPLHNPGCRKEKDCGCDLKPILIGMKAKDGTIWNGVKWIKPQV